MKVLVGKDAVDFSVTTQRVCAESSFFQAACTPEWIAEGGNTIILKYEDPITFALFSDFLSTSRIIKPEDMTNVTSNSPGAGNQRQALWMLLLQCYVLGQRLGAQKFMNSAMDLLICLCSKIWARDKTVAGIEPESIAFIWENAPTGSPLHRLVLDNCFKHATHDNPTMSKAILNPAVSSYGAFLVELAMHSLLLARTHEWSFPEVYHDNTCEKFHEHVGERCAVRNPFMNSSNFNTPTIPKDEATERPPIPSLDSGSSSSSALTSGSGSSSKFSSGSQVSSNIS